MALAAIKAKLGDSAGKAVGFLLFGGFGVPGLVDAAQLAAAGNAEKADEVTQELALRLVSDCAKETIIQILKDRIAPAMEEAELTAEIIASTALIIVTGLLDSTPIADEPPPGVPGAPPNLGPPVGPPQQLPQPEPNPNPEQPPQKEPERPPDPGPVEQPDQPTEQPPDPPDDDQPDPGTGDPMLHRKPL